MGTHDNMYPLHTGILTKSPPDTRVTGNFKRWRRRWFVLWEDKMLEYYADRGDPSPIKKIDLSRCEFLDTNLSVSAKKLENIFSIKVGGKSVKTSGRTYFLAADTPYEMTTWVDKICQLCGFKAKENNNNSDAKIRHEHAPLDKETTAVSRGRERDSGIIVREGDTGEGDLVAVKVVIPSVSSVYDDVPPPRPTTHALDNDEQPPYDVPPHPGMSSPRSHVNSGTPCPLDVSSSSESSLPSISTDDVRTRRTSEGNYDYPPTYPSSQTTYDVPPKFNGYPSPNYVGPPKRSSGSSNSDEGNEIYDVPPQPTYDVVPPPVSAAQSRTLPVQRGMSRVEYPPTGRGQQFSSQSTPLYANCNISSTVRPNISSNTGVEGKGIYDHVPSRAEATYDTVPRPVSLPSGDNYDYVPPPVPVDVTDGYEDDAAPPPIPRQSKPLPRTYVNLEFPPDQDKYNKLLPNTPRDMQRDSGTVLDNDLDEAVYDVPPVQPGHHAPSVDRTMKPDVSFAPRVNRGSKPGHNQPPDYVNLPGPMRSATVKEGHTPRRGGNVQRSRSAAADTETEGYLYMESPKRTDSSTRYTRTNRESSFNEEEENDAYIYMHRNEHDMTYQNFDPPQPTISSPERTPQLRGHYQAIEIVHKGEVPSIPQRSPRTQYTTIDLKKTEGFRRTCEDVVKDM